jgi:hypothetical protein
VLFIDHRYGITTFRVRRRMKHKFEECKIKLRAIHRTAKLIKEGAGELDDIVIATLAEQIQQDAILLESEDER